MCVLVSVFCEIRLDPRELGLVRLGRNRLLGSLLEVGRREGKLSGFGWPSAARAGLTEGVLCELALALEPPTGVRASRATRGCNDYHAGGDILR